MDDLLLIVVGAHLRAEQNDRPVAYHLRELVLGWLQKQEEALGEAIGLRPLVCTDVWYLNDPSLASCPAIAVGAPGVNAFTAYLGDKLPSAFVVDDQMIVQLDPEFGELIAACWGRSHAQTQQACAVFADRYLDAFMNAAASERA